MYGRIPQVVQDLLKDFEFFKLTKVLKENCTCRCTHWFGSNPKDQIKRTILVQKIDRPSMILASEKDKIVTPISEITNMEVDINPPNKDTKVAAADWRLPIIQYIIDITLPDNKWEAYLVMDDKLNR